MEERESDKRETFSTDQPSAPGEMSNQNAEEVDYPAGSGSSSGGGASDGGASDGASGGGDAGKEGGPHRRAGDGDPDEESGAGGGRVGGAGEGSQATGNPLNAG